MPTFSLPDDTAPRVEVRIRHATERHSGGSWKVAYADFATAMMSLFIVLWLMSANQKVKASVGSYFHDPVKFQRTVKAEAAKAKQGEAGVANRNNMADIREQLEQAISAMPEFASLRDNVKFSATGEGLRIDLLETDQGLFFISGCPAPTPAGKELLRVLARKISQMPNSVVIEGHTDANPFRNSNPTEGYSNWELASDRANAARRLLHQYGMRPAQVVEVRGFADQQPFNDQDRFDSRNRRVSVVVRFKA